MKEHSRSHTSWQNVERWYDSIVGYWGHYYHTHVIIPQLKKLLHLDKTSNLLDLACGQGVLARHLPKSITYTGVDASASFIQKAKEYHRQDSHCSFIEQDITQPLQVTSKNYTHCTIILALQNIEHPQSVFANLKSVLKKGARLYIVLNHPCFRIPRQTSWGFDEKSKLQFRKVNCYMSSQKIPILQNPSEDEQSEKTWSFHHPLSSYVQWLAASGFVVSNMFEWCSDKTSVGKAAKWENRARQEFPLFLTIEATFTG